MNEQNFNTLWKHSKEWFMLAGFDIDRAKEYERSAYWFIKRERLNYDYERQCEIQVVDQIKN
jgi:hypothetical protein